jgi:hypothetical protein
LDLKFYKKGESMKSYLVSLTVLLFCLIVDSAFAADPNQPVSDPLSGTDLYKTVLKYSEFDNHQTGMKGDIATSKWIADELKKAGLQTELKPWGLNQFFLESCEVKVDGNPIESFPGWYPNTDPVNGQLALFDPSHTDNLKNHIAFAGLKYGAVSNTGIIKLVEKVREAGAVGLIVAVKNFGDSGLLTAANAEQKDQGPEYYQIPLPIPTVIVAGADASKMTEAASAGKEASIKITGASKKNITAYNVVGRLKRGDQWVIITTPSAGWFQCSGERGPGVALFLGLARWAAKSDSKYSYIFIANSGHEMAYMGAHYAPAEYLPENKISKENVACWFHLGAAIGCRTWKKNGIVFEPQKEPNKVYYLAAVPELLDPVKAAFGEVKGLTIGSGNYAGELINIVKKGYRACGFFGSNYFFHTRRDNENETSPELLDPVGKGIVHFFKTLENR